MIRHGYKIEDTKYETSAFASLSSSPPRSAKARLAAIIERGFLRMEREIEKTVLAVNDAPDSLEVISRLLRKSGYRVLTATDGREGFEVAQAEHPDLIVSDVSMPRPDGIEMCRLIRKHKDLGLTPILLVSAVHIDNESVVEGIKAGADDYLEAPYDSMLLITKVAQLIECKRAEKALRESEERYQAFVANCSEAVWRFEMDVHAPIDLPEDAQIEHFYEYGFLAECNDVMAHMYGLAHAEELIGMKLVQLLPPSDPRNIDYLRVFIQSGYRLIDAESQERDREGNAKWFLNNLIGIVEQGKIRRAWGTQRDITERKRAEQELSRSEERYRDMVENAHDIIYSHDLLGNYTSVNKAGERITGYTREEALKLNLNQTVAPEYLDKAHQMLARKLAGEEVTAYDLDLIAKDGRQIAVEVNTRLVYQNNVAVGVQGIARDITERKRAEEMLRVADRRAVEEYERLLDRLSRLALTFGTARDLQTIYRGLRDFTLALTPSFALVICHYDEARGVREGAYFYMNGVELENPEVGEMPVRSGPAGRVIKSGTAMIFNDYLRQINEGGSALNIGFDVDTGHPRSALIAPMAIMGSVIGTIEVQSHQLGAYTREHATSIQMAANLAANAIENVRLLNLEREKGEQLRQAQKMEAVGRLAGGIAHDFNNLLTAITGYSDLTLRRLQPDTPLRRNVEEIKKAGDRAASLTRQLLAFSRKQVLQPKVLNLNVVVSDMEKMLQRLIGEHIELRTVLASDIGSVKADPGQIEQVIMNLAVNARDAMPHGGNLIIETENIYLNEGYATRHIAVKPGAYVMLAVSDTGEGMSEETQSRIFEPFFTTKEVGKGTGLGLSTVYGIVKQSGGNIWVYSEVGEGTAFKIYLPRVDEAAQEYKPSHEVEESLDGTEIILLAEDDERVRGLVRAVLEGYGYQVLEAEDGSAALSVSERHEGLIHLLLTDVVMPKMSGRELADQLAESRPEMKVLYMSGYTDESIVHHGVLDANTPFIQKPFEPEALARKVRELLDEEARG